MKKTILTTVFILCSLLSFSQVPWSQSVPSTNSLYTEVVSNTIYKSPMISAMLEKAFLDVETNITFLVRAGVWIYPIKKENNFIIIQMGAHKTWNLKKKKTISTGFLLMNFQGRAFPRPSYDSMHHAKDAGYLSPFTAFATLKPFPNKRFSVTSDVSYYTNLNKLATSITFSYQIFKRYEE